jgi:hypothetical protein
MNRADHHQEAERLLLKAPEEQDSVRRSLILAEAQVHATLALSAAPGASPPGQGQPESRGTTRDADLAPSTLRPYGKGRTSEKGRTTPAKPARPPADTTATTSMRASLTGPRPWVVDTPHGPAQPLSYSEPAQPGKRGPAGKSREPDVDDLDDEEPAGPGKQEPGTTERPPAPDDPAGQEPGGFGFRPL